MSARTRLTAKQQRFVEEYIHDLNASHGGDGDLNDATRTRSLPQARACAP